MFVVALVRPPFDKAQNSLPRPDRDLENDGDGEQNIDQLCHRMRRIGEPVDKFCRDHDAKEFAGPRQCAGDDGLHR